MSERTVPENVRVLLVEDNPGDARLVREMLSEARGTEYELEHVQRLSDALERLAIQRYDVVLLDLGLPDGRGIDTVVRTYRQAPEVPIVVMTGMDNEDLALQAVHEGAQDYHVKGQIESRSLIRAIRSAIERKALDRRLTQALDQLTRQAQELEAFNYSISHDLKEPLRTIQAFSQFLLEDYAAILDEQGRDYLERIGRASEHMKALIEDLLTLSRLSQKGEAPQKVDLNLVLRDVTEGLETTIESRNAAVSVEPELPVVIGHISHMEQIFANLIGNALKFNTSGRPEVAIGMKDRKQGRGVFYVQDNGIGISPEYHDRVFGIFQRLHTKEEYEGTGAGLAIVRRAVEVSGGRVWLESQEGVGTTFYVELPLWNEGAAVRPARAVAA